MRIINTKLNKHKMNLNKLITKKINEYALNGDANLLEQYGFLITMIAKEYAAEQLILSGVSNWVAISDRKPPKEWSNYMVCLENNSIFQANYCRIGTERWLIVGVGEITNENPVLYWMEEPKPPCC